MEGVKRSLGLSGILQRRQAGQAEGTSQVRLTGSRCSNYFTGLTREAKKLEDLMVAFVSSVHRLILQALPMFLVTLAYSGDQR